MLELKLKREYFPNRTEGVIEGTFRKLTTLERPWLDNQVNVSCIPEGTYTVERDKHGRHTWFKVNDVEGRTAIEIHEGYKVSHSAGCILLDLIELQDLMILTEGQPFTLKIYS